MKVYSNTDVDLTYQNQGSSFLCILRGKHSDIELVFNGLFNLCGTSCRELNYNDHTKTIATFWTDRNNLRRFFFNQHLMRHLPPYGEPCGKIIRESMKYSLDKLKTMKETSHEMFTNFHDVFVPSVFSVGTIRAENPDHDFRDAVLAYAFKDKETIQTPIESN